MEGGAIGKDTSPASDIKTEVVPKKETTKRALVSVENLQSNIDILRGPKLSFPMKVGFGGTNALLVYAAVTGGVLSHLTLASGLVTLGIFAVVNTVLIGAVNTVESFHPLRDRRRKQKEDENMLKYGRRHPEYRNCNLDEVKRKWTEYQLDLKVDDYTGRLATYTMYGIVFAIGAVMTLKQDYSMLGLPISLNLSFQQNVTLVLNNWQTAVGTLGVFGASLYFINVGVNNGLNRLLFPLTERYSNWKYRDKEAEADEVEKVSSSKEKETEVG